METILKLLRKGVKDKKCYRDLFYDVANETDKLLKDYGYDEETAAISFRMIGETAEERLKAMKEAYASASGNPRVLLPSVVAACSNALDLFLEKYRIGYVREIYLNQTGELYVELGMSVSLDEKKMEEQMDILNDLGLSVIVRRRRISVVADDENREILCSLLRTLGARNIQYTVYENRMEGPLYRTVSFYLAAESLREYAKKERADKVKEREEKSDVLTDKELKILETDVERLIAVLDNIDERPDMIPNIGHLSSSLLHECCKILDIKPEIYTRYEALIQREKDKVKAMTDLEEKMGTMSETMNVREETQTLSEDLNSYFSSNFPFFLSDILISRYQTRLKLIQNAFYEDTGEEGLTMLKSTSEYYVIASEDNFKSLEEHIRKDIPGSEVAGYEVETLKGSRVIKSLSVTLSKIPGKMS